MINPPLILVSALFFLGLTAVLYLLSWLGATATLRAARARISHAGAKKLLALGLIAPPLAAIAMTIGGATLRHSHAIPTAEHHSLSCMEAYTILSSVPILVWSTASRLAAGAAANGLAWVLILTGIYLFIRLLDATHGLEKGLAPYLNSPSPKFKRALRRIEARMNHFPTARFFECPIPPTYSSVVGLLHPRCVLSQELVSSSTDDELDAIVAHEASHLRERDVWATSVVGAINCMFFFLRPVRLLSRRWRAEAEMACDAGAATITGKPLSMAAAILRASGTPVGAGLPGGRLPAVALCFADESACSPSKRIEQLIARAEKASFTQSEMSPAHTFLGWLLTLLLTGFGAAILLSTQVACYAHCSLEALARLLP